MATAPRQVPKVYPAGTGRPTERKLTDEKVVRAVNVSGTVWDAGKKRAGQDAVSISHAVGLFIEAYAAGLLDLDTITAQLDALAAGEDPVAAPGAGAWTEEAPPAFAVHPSWSSPEGLPSGLDLPPGWSSSDDVPDAFDILDAEDRP
ncbi:hypothetical protein ABTX85_34155 [Streptomyces sp. NPDC096097]|uniref:hypothetical protein n=1 Tax=Streptomyces sp. NPDC096097 TaxID=3155546 RepID=UPI00333051F2